MKISLQHLLISFGGSFIAVATFVGILLVVDKIWGDDEADEKRPLEEMVISYFDAHGVEYEKVDSCNYRFTYNDNIYFWKYYPEDSEFLQIIAFWEAPAKNQNELLALANQLNAEWKFIKIFVDEENDAIFAFE